MPEIIKYDGCTYQCYLKQIKSRTGKPYYRAFCRRQDPKCIPGKMPAAKPEGVINAPTTKDAEKLRDKADAMTAQVEAKKNPPVAQQRVTARRAGQIASARLQAEALEKIQTQLYAISDMIDAGTLPTVLWNVKSKADVERIQHYGKYERDIPTAADVKRESYAPAKKELQRDVSAFHKMGIANKSQLKEAYTALTAMLKAETPEEKAEKRIEAMERELIGRKIPGYFPTSTEISEEMVVEADIQPGMTVLEPSAGTGYIAEVIERRRPQANLSVIELQDDLVKILRAKGFNVIARDFLEYDKAKFDRILQNPPFEKGQDIKHVYHAYKTLKPGGRLISLMSEGPFFRTYKADVAFREFLKKHRGRSVKLSPYAFLSSERPTGVQARMVIIDKPKGET